jgi:hypothetical protein
VVDDGRTGARPAGTVRRGNVGRDLLDTLWHVRRTRPRHGPHRQSTDTQLVDDRRAGSTRRSHNDMERGSRRHRRSLRINDRLPAGILATDDDDVHEERVLDGVLGA